MKKEKEYNIGDIIYYVEGSSKVIVETEISEIIEYNDKYEYIDTFNKNVKDNTIYKTIQECYDKIYNDKLLRIEAAKHKADVYKQTFIDKN